MVLNFNKIIRCFKGENDLFEDITNALGLFASSALFVLYLTIVLGPVR